MDAEHDKLHVNRELSSSSRAECLAKVDNILRRPTSRAWRSFLSPDYRTEVPEGTRWPAKFHPWHWSDVASRQRKLIHNHTAATCLCRVRLGCVNWIPDNSRLSPTENLQHEHVRSNRPHRHTRHDTDKTVLSRLVWRCEPSPPDKCVQRRSVSGSAGTAGATAGRTPTQNALVGPPQFTPPHHCRACLSTAAAATQARQAATPSRVVRHANCKHAVCTAAYD